MKQTPRDIARPSVSGANLEHRENAPTELSKTNGILLTEETDGHTCVDASDETLPTCSLLRAAVSAISAQADIFAFSLPARP